jgi:hypothetical protein
VGSWKDGPSGAKGQDYITAKHHKSHFTTSEPFSVIAMKASLKAALQNKERRSTIIQAINAEIDNFEQPGVLAPMKFGDIPPEYRKHIIGVYMFHKEKYKADGAFDKDKMRLVLLSNLRDPDTIGESFSPTVNPISVMTQLNLAAVRKGTDISAFDIKGAFLLTPMQPNIRMFIRVNPDVTTYWLARYPNRTRWLAKDGCLYFELKRYVYGLHEASHEFNGFLDKKLKEIGFQPTKADNCLYVRKTDDGDMILSAHVDDMLLTSPNIKWRKWFEKQMEKYFTLVKQYGNVSYLGISIKQDPRTGNIDLNQHGFITSLIKKYKFDKLAKYPTLPGNDSLCSEPDQPGPANSKEYLSLVMSLMYLARFTRPDIHFAVSYLATKSNNPTVSDQKKLERVLKYVAGTQYEGIRYLSNVPFRPSISADASHHLYPEGHGQEGMIITNGSAPVAHRSVKIKLITRSSSESELCALEEASTYAVWYSLLLRELSVPNVKPIVIYQDNKSTIIMAIQGATFKRTKHIIGRQSYVRERIMNGDIKLLYQPTADMKADIMTKPLSLQPFNRFKQLLCMYRSA